MTDSTDTTTLAGEWLARLQPGAPDWINEMTRARLTGAIGTGRFDSLFALSLTMPGLDAAGLAALVDRGDGDALRRALTSRADPERCARARAQVETLCQGMSGAKAQAGVGLCLMAAWMAGDELTVRRYAPYAGIDPDAVGRTRDPAWRPRVLDSTAAVIVDFAVHMGWWPDGRVHTLIPRLPAMPAIPTLA